MRITLREQYSTNQGLRDVATYDGMHTAGGVSAPLANSPAFAGLLARSRTTHSRGVDLMSEAAPAVLTLGLSRLRARARATILQMFRSPAPEPTHETPASHFGGGPPSTSNL
jgi:hypothetical protein